MGLRAPPARASLGGIEADGGPRADVMLGQPGPVSWPGWPTGGRLQATGETARGRDRHRLVPGPSPDAVASAAWSAVRGRRAASRLPLERAQRSATRDTLSPVRWASPRRDLPVRIAPSRPLLELGPSAGAHRAGGGLLPRAGPLPRRGLRRGHLLRHARARPRRRGALARRPEAPAGPRGARGRGVGLPRRARGVHGPRDADRLRRGRRRVVPLERPAHEQRRRRVAKGRSQPPAAGHRRGGARGGLRARLGRDRGDHELHEHVEPVGDDRRGPAGEEGGRGRARAHAVGQDLARAGLEGRDRVPRARRPDRAALEARLRPRRLRLHHLHRELRPAAGGGLQGDRGARPRGGERAVRQPQLRGPHPPRGEDELPRLAAALRGLRAGRPHGPRHRERAAPERRLPARHLADAAGGERDDREGDRVGHVPALVRRRAVRGRRQLEVRSRSRRATATPGTTSPPT